MEPDSRGIIIGLQGFMFALSLGIFVPLIGWVYDNHGGVIAQRVPFGLMLTYVITLFIFIVYRHKHNYKD